MCLFLSNVLINCVKWMWTFYFCLNAIMLNFTPNQFHLSPLPLIKNVIVLFPLVRPQKLYSTDDEHSVGLILCPMRKKIQGFWLFIFFSLRHDNYLTFIFTIGKFYVMNLWNISDEVCLNFFIFSSDNGELPPVGARHTQNIIFEPKETVLRTTR